jgi:hypothetical protein
LNLLSHQFGRFQGNGWWNLCMGKFREEIVSLQFSEIFGTEKWYNSNDQDCQSLHCNIPPDQTENI